jgi:enediyne biosynthesis protein E3
VAGSLGRLRRRLLTPSADKTAAGKRGFHIKDESTQQLLGTTPMYFRTGFGEALETGDPVETAARLERLERPYRGFAYEGAAMGLAILDVLSLRRHDRIARFIAGPAQRYAHAAHIGLGFALTRAPRGRWRLIESADPLLRWRVLDGYGFAQAFFRTDRYVHAQYQEPDFPWPKGYPDYANRGIDQGIGRALWFIGGASIPHVTGLIGGFPESRQPDLWSGTGLAATYAGGATEQELQSLRERSGPFRAHLLQGSALAALTRVSTGLVTDGTRMATAALCGMSPEQAESLASRALTGLPPDAELPAFEIWRQRVAAEFGALDAGTPKTRASSE